MMEENWDGGRVLYGHAMQNGPGDASKKFRLLEIAAAAGLPEAMHLVAFEYQRGYFDCVEPDPAFAELMYRRAAAAGFACSSFELAKIYLERGGAHCEENGLWYYDFNYLEAWQSDEERIMKAVDGILVASGKKYEEVYGSRGGAPEGSGLPTEEQGKALQEAFGWLRKATVKFELDHPAGARLKAHPAFKYGGLLHPAWDEMRETYPYATLRYALGLMIAYQKCGDDGVDRLGRPMPLLSNAARKLANDSLIYAALGGIAAACLTIADFVLFREPCDTQSLIDSIHNVETPRIIGNVARCPGAEKSAEQIRVTYASEELRPAMFHGVAMFYYEMARAMSEDLPRSARTPTKEQAQNRITALNLMAERNANESAKALLALEEAEAEEAKKSKAKTKKGKGKAKAAADAGSSSSPAKQPEPEPEPEPEPPLADPAASLEADKALRAAAATGDLETLAAALEAHRAAASEAVVAEARALRDKLKEKRKKQSQKLRKAHGEAMAAHGALQTAQEAQDAGALQSALATAAPLRAALPALDEEVEVAQATLESLNLAAPEGGGRGGRGRGGRGRGGRGAAAPPPPPERVTAVELTLAELDAATDGFAAARLIGSGGFGNVYAADAMASLRVELRPVDLRELKPAVKRAFADVELRDLKKEVELLHTHAHAHLLPLFGFCLDAQAPCLCFPLMVGGSLRARIDLGPDDLASLYRMGRFTPEAPPSPLTWRQKLRAVVQAAEALAYLHGQRTLHRDFKEANILLDGGLHAYLSDTGFAKAAHRGGGGGGATVGMSTTVGGGALGYTPGYADEDVLLGKYSESSDGFAVGRTLLAVLTRRSAIEIIDRIEEAHDADFEELDAEKLGEAGAGWTAAAAEAIRTAYLALCHTKKRKRAPLAEVLPPLRALVEAPGGEAAPSGAPSSSSQAALPAPTPLSVQVRGMRQRADDPALSIQRNVSDAFDGFMRRVGKIAEKKVGEGGARGAQDRRLPRRVRRPDQLVPQADDPRPRPRREPPPPPRVAQRGDPPRGGAVGEGGAGERRGGVAAHRRDRWGAGGVGISLVYGA